MLINTLLLKFYDILAIHNKLNFILGLKPELFFDQIKTYVANLS